MATHNDIGRQGEEMARDYLVQQGCKILKQNFRTYNAELDIIAQKGNQLIFVEVKTRTGVSFGLPEIFVSRDKIKQMKKGAEAYINMSKYEGDARFDIISVIINKFGSHQLEHFEDAFFL